MFKKIFSCFGIKFGVSYYIKKKNFLPKKNASHTISIYEKILIIDFSCNFLTSIFPYMKIV